MKKIGFGKYYIIGIAVIAFGAACFLIYKDLHQKNLNKNNSVYTSPSTSEYFDPEIHANSNSITSEPSNIQIKNSVNLDVPFTSQAPYANWDTLHNEACEEASVLMVRQYIIGDYDAKLPPSFAEDQIQKMVAFEIPIFGASQKNLTAAETLKYLVNGFYRMSGGQVLSFSVDGIKRELSAGKPVIVPAAGQLLGNPNFKTPGPVYHMVVIVGYDSKNFITNDPGTRNGYKYKYTFDTLFNAVHDWNGTSDKINSGQKVYIVLN
jgi:hypothetical protein